MSHRWMNFGLAGLVAAGIAGCASSPPPQPQSLDRQDARPAEERGAGAIQVVVQNGSVRTDLERRHEPDQLVAAAEAALRSRGFVMPPDAHRNRLEEPITVSGVMGGTPGSRRADVSLLIGPTKVRFEVAIKPWGNDAEARAILKRMLELLGYGAER
ncbi:MAG: hypothetical protein QM783_09840 [Phycisphaerales bacterium]